MDIPLLDWEIVGEIANLAQLTGLDAVKLIALIVKAATSTQILKRRCLHFAEYLQPIGVLLEKAMTTELMEYDETRAPLKRLEDVLRRSYVLVDFCKKRRYPNLLIAGCCIANKLKQAQEEIDNCLKIIPLVILVDNQRFKALFMQGQSDKLIDDADRDKLIDDADRDKLIDDADKNSLIKIEARLAVEWMEPKVWEQVLHPQNQFRRQLIDQVVSTALPESKNPDQVSATLKAFMTADLPHELIRLLDKIVLQNSAFSGNPNLQTLLILTAIKADKSRVMDYVNRLNNFDDPEIGEIAVGAELYEEAFAIFQKSNLNVQAVNVILDNIGSIERAVQFASRVEEHAVYSQVAKAQLREGFVSDAIESFIRADDATRFLDVIRAAEQTNVYHDLVKYLLMVRKKVEEPKVDSQLIYAYAKIDRTGDIEEFIVTPNVANLQSMGDRLFDEALYEAAEIIFSFISNWAKLATTLVKLGQFQRAVQAAHVAESLKTWKEVCFACVDAKKFELAHICGLKIIGQVDDFKEVSDYYQNRGHLVELISLMESGWVLERSHMGVF